MTDSKTDYVICDQYLRSIFKNILGLILQIAFKETQLEMIVLR